MSARSRPAMRMRCTRGFTLPELLIVLVLFGVIAAAATSILRTQQRFLRGAAELGEMRSQLRQAVHLLPAELRAVAPDAGDVQEWSTSAIRFRALTGSAVVCRRASDTVLIVPPHEGGDDRALTTWLVTPRAGDSLLVHDEGDVGSGDDVWRAYELAAIGPASLIDDCTAKDTWRSASEDAAAAVRLRVGGRLSGTIQAGAPVRFYHPVRYALYRGGDAHWYLGASDCNAARAPPCSTIQPISGPYLPRGTGSDGGLSLTFEDASGRLLTPGVDDPLHIALVRMVVRAEMAHPWWRSTAHTLVRDSLAFAVSTRNRIATDAGGVR